MTNAKQTAMALYGFHEWPATHVRTPKAVDCRAYTCVLLEQEGYSRKQIADEIGFYDKSGVCHAIKVFKEKNMRDEATTDLSKKLRDRAKATDLRADMLVMEEAASALAKVRNDALDEAAYAGYVTCAKTRHVTLGGKVYANILALKTEQKETP